MAEKITTVFRTNDYSQFNKLVGNRAVTRDRVMAIIESVNTVGYVLSPIVVNEKMEIIDGQGRAEAFEELGLPIDYVIAEGAGIAECIQLNIKQKNWGLNDFVDSYFDQGNAAYGFLKNMLEYGFPIQTVLSIQTGGSGINYHDNVVSTNAIKKGEYCCSYSTFSKTCEMLEQLKPFTELQSKVGGSKYKFFNCIAFCLEHPEVDNDYLLEVLQKATYTLPSCYKVEEFMRAIDSVYNFHKKKQIRIFDDYIRSTDYRKGKRMTKPWEFKSLYIE